MSEPTNPNTQTQEPASQQTTNFQLSDGDFEKIASLISGKQSVTEETVLKSYFKNQGLSAEEMQQAITAFKDQKAKNTPNVEQLQSDLNNANSARVVAEINQIAQLEAIKQGVDVKSIPYVLKMADFSGVTKTDGTYDNEKLTGAITKVLEDIPALKNSYDGDGGKGVTKIGGEGNVNGNGNKPNANNGGVPAKKWNKFNI